MYSNAPTIGGSKAGEFYPRAPEKPIANLYAAFIVLVVILAVIVIIASISIFYLLRKRGASSKERAAPRRYSIKPTGLPGSLSSRIGSWFKSRRRNSAGWEPAKDEEDEWDSKDEPVHHLPDLPYDPAYPRVDSAPPSHRATLTEASESLHKSRMASHVEDPSREDFGRYDPPSPFVPMPIVQVQAPSAPNEVWLNAHDGRGGLGSIHTGANTSYYAPQPRRADSSPEIPLFAGSIPFR